MRLFIFWHFSSLGLYAILFSVLLSGLTMCNIEKWRIVRWITAMIPLVAEVEWILRFGHFSEGLSGIWYAFGYEGAWIVSGAMVPACIISNVTILIVAERSLRRKRKEAGKVLGAEE